MVGPIPGRERLVESFARLQGAAQGGGKVRRVLAPGRPALDVARGQLDDRVVVPIVQVEAGLDDGVVHVLPALLHERPEQLAGLVPLARLLIGVGFSAEGRRVLRLQLQGLVELGDGVVELPLPDPDLAQDDVGKGRARSQLDGPEHVRGRLLEAAPDQGDPAQHRHDLGVVGVLAKELRAEVAGLVPLGGAERLLRLPPLDGVLEPSHRLIASGLRIMDSTGGRSMSCPGPAAAHGL